MMTLKLLALAALALVGSHAGPLHIVVAADGSGDFRTVQMAIDHAPPYRDRRLIIEIRPGTYRERVKIPQDRPRLTLLGTDPATTIITFNAGAKDVGGTFFSSTVEIDGAAFEAANLTFENSYGVGTQAVALMIHSDRAVFQNCRFIGWQDTLYAASGRQYYRDCFIEGHVDFICGNAAAVFDKCEIHSRGNGYITAQSRNLPDDPTGFVFIQCKLTGEPDSQVYLGRPWRAYSRVIYINCWMADHIQPAGWSKWNNTDNDKNSWYAEYGSTGSGAREDQRVSWSHSLTSSEIREFEPNVFLRGTDKWQPAEIKIGTR